MTDPASAGFATLRFAREIAAPVATLWQAWSAPAARAIWSAPSPEITVEFLEAETRVGGREISVCSAPEGPEIRTECRWLVLEPQSHSVNSELVTRAGTDLSAALVTAFCRDLGATSRLEITVQLSSLAEDMEAGYRQGFAAGLDQLAGLSQRMMVLERVIAAPRDAVWKAWTNPETLPLWWGPEGYSCRTSRIDLRTGGEWVFDMIAADGRVFPNHHRYHVMTPQSALSYSLLWGENGPKHADAWAGFEDVAGTGGTATRVTLAMAFATGAELQDALDFGAAALGAETLGKLARFVGAP